MLLEGTICLTIPNTDAKPKTATLLNSQCWCLNRRIGRKELGIGIEKGFGIGMLLQGGKHICDRKRRKSSEKCLLAVEVN